MKKVYEYDLVRGMYFHEGLSKREISRRTKLHRQTVKRLLEYSSPPGYQSTVPRPKTKLDPFIPIIDKILEDDKKSPKKQRHTAKRILQRLQEEHGFTGGYTIVKGYVREKKLKLKDVFFPLNQSPGTSQIDFGSCEVIIDGVKQAGHYFCMSLPFSDALYSQVYPTEAFEAVAAGHNSAYKFFGGVPPESLYDNMSTVVKKILEGHDRELTDSFLSLRSHLFLRAGFAMWLAAMKREWSKVVWDMSGETFWCRSHAFPVGKRSMPTLNKSA